MQGDAEQTGRTRENSDPGAQDAGPWAALLPLLSDLIPLFLDKWSEVHQRPSVRDLEERQSRMGRRIKELRSRLNWQRILLVLLIIWNTVLTTLFVIK